MKIKRNLIFGIAVLVFGLLIIFLNLNSFYKFGKYSEGEVSFNSIDSATLKEKNAESFFSSATPITGAVVLDSSAPQEKGLPTPKDIVDGNCKSASKESNEGPGGENCDHADYEECFDYFTKSTVSACKDPLFGCMTINTGTDYCVNSYTLNEAFLNCGVLTIGSDFLDWQQKNCNDYEGYSDWVTYCNANEVRKKRLYSDYGCSNGRCSLISSNWVNDQLISRKGDIGYCNDRKKNSCTGCNEEDYDCDWSSDCSGSLQCKGSAAVTYCPLAECGCCTLDTRWDSTLKTCCECSSGDGPCCDGCNYKSTATVCDSNYGSYSYSCADGKCLDNDVFKRDRKRYCSGSSSSCDGDVEWNTPIIQESCSSSEFCDGASSLWQVSPTPFCTTAQCTSGVCCDTTCGSYEFKSNEEICSHTYEQGCSGENLGDDVRFRFNPQYCSGSSSSCNGIIREGDWIPFTDCASNEYCRNEECVPINCSKNSDCGTNGLTGGNYCKNENVYKKFRTYSCNNPGTPSSSCSSSDREDLIETCVYGCLNGACKSSSSICTSNSDCVPEGYTENNFCKSGNVWQNSTTYKCNNPGTTSSSCSHTDNETQKQVCSNGCANGICNNSTGSIACSSDSNCSIDKWTGTPSCFLNDVWQTYIDYYCDKPGTISSSCKSSETNTVKEDCANGCENNACKLPDLVATDLVVQSLKDRKITLAFTIKNIGNAVANNVYWMVDTNSATGTTKRTNAISLEPGKSTRAYMNWEYSNSGIYNPKIIVDSDNFVKELNENNNEISVQVTV